MKKNPALLLLISGLISLYFAPSALAQSTMTAIPPRVELKANPGQTLSADLKIANGTDTTQTYDIMVQDFIVSDNIGTPIPVTSQVSGRWSLSNWIKVPSTVPVDARSTQTVKMSINVPANAFAGGHYAMVTYQLSTVKSGDMKKTGSALTQRTGTLVYVTVNGDIKMDAALRLFSTPKFNEFGPVKFDGNVENLSDTHIAPKGQITIKDFLGRTVAVLPLEPGNIFPQASRDFSASWNTRWGYGHYQAILELAYGTAGGMLTSTIFFWLFPIRLVIYVLIIVIAILLVITLLNQKNRRHEQMLASEIDELKKEIEELEQTKK